jgi:hypothetical protein
MTKRPLTGQEVPFVGTPRASICASRYPEWHAHMDLSGRGRCCAREACIGLAHVPQEVPVRD